MNTKLDSINIEDVLFWDLETVREHEFLDENSIAFKLFQQKNRNKETDELPSVEETKELYLRKGALNPTHTKIVCLSMAFVKNNVINVKSLYGEQVEIITEFSKVLKKGYIPCGWNIVKFDLPILRVKAWQEGIVDFAPEAFNDAGKKEWAVTEVKYKTNVIDLMLFYQGSHYSSSTLGEACYVLGVDTPKDDIDGSKVSDVYYAEGVDRIKTYCEKDVVACVQLFQKMRGEEIITEIAYKNGDSKKEKSVLVRLAEENYLSDSIKKDLTTMLKKSKFTAKDRERVEDIIISAYVKSTFSTEDSSATDTDDIKEFKINEVKDFLDGYLKK